MNNPGNNIPRITNALNYISDDKISKADKPRRKRPPMSLFYSIGGVCAAAAILVFVVPKIKPIDPITSSPTESGDPAKFREFSINYDNLPFTYDGTDTQRRFQREAWTNIYEKEEYWAYTASELIGNNPWNKDLKITELPVFLGGMYSMNTKSKALPDELPQGYSFLNYDLVDRMSTVRYLAETYPDLLGFSDYEISVWNDYSNMGNPLYNIHLYETADNAFDAIMNYNFCKVSYAPTTGRNGCLLREPGFEELRCVGFYPIVSVEEALESNTSSAFPFKPSEIDLSLNNYELVYRLTTDRTMLPFYRFLIEKETDQELPEEMKIFKEYYLPAVSSEYLADAKTQSETREPLANPFTPYKGKEFVIDYDDLPFEYDGTNEPLYFDAPSKEHSYSQNAYDVTELLGNNPWNESLNITELPVFANEPIAEEYIGQNNMITIKALLPQGYSLHMYDNPEMLVSAYEYLIEKYGGDLGITDYEFDITHDYSYDGDPHFDCEIYESSDNIFNAILNYNFSRIYFGYDSYNNEINIIYDNIAKKKAVGFYPIITADEARKMLLNGGYSINQTDHPLDSSRIKAVSLVYKLTQKYYIPFYELYYEVDDSHRDRNTPEGMNEYVIFFVPAISPDSYKDFTEVCDKATFKSDYGDLPAGTKGWVVQKWENPDGSVEYDVKIEDSEQTVRNVPAEYLEITKTEPRTVSTTSQHNSQ